MSISSEIVRLNNAKTAFNTFLTDNGIDTTSMNLNQMVNALGNLPKWTPGAGLKLSETGELSTDLNISKEGGYTVAVSPPSGDSSKKIATTEWVLQNASLKQASVTLYEKVLFPSGWSSDGTRTITVDNVDPATSKIFIEPNWLDAAMVANADQMLKANIVCTGVGSGSATLKCLGEVPTVPVCIRVYVMDQVVKNVYTFNLTSGSWVSSNSTQSVSVEDGVITTDSKVIASPNYTNVSDNGTASSIAKANVVLTDIGNGYLTFTALGGIPTVGVPIIAYVFN